VKYLWHSHFSAGKLALKEAGNEKEVLRRAHFSCNRRACDWVFGFSAKIFSGRLIKSLPWLLELCCAVKNIKRLSARLEFGLQLCDFADCEVLNLSEQRFILR
jgi:phage terminase large subunit-like protein